MKEQNSFFKKNALTGFSARNPEKSKGPNAAIRPNSFEKGKNSPCSNHKLKRWKKTKGEYGLGNRPKSYWKITSALW